MAMNLAHMAQAYAAIQKATKEGDLEKGVQFIGQVQGIIHDLPAVAEVIERTVKEAQALQANLRGKLE